MDRCDRLFELPDCLVTVAKLCFNKPDSAILTIRYGIANPPRITVGEARIWLRNTSANDVRLHGKGSHIRPGSNP